MLDAAAEIAGARRQQAEAVPEPLQGDVQGQGAVDVQRLHAPGVLHGLDRGLAVLEFRQRDLILLVIGKLRPLWRSGAASITQRSTPK